MEKDKPAEISVASEKLEPASDIAPASRVSNPSSIVTERYGSAKTFDPDFKGPVKHRSCTDVICLIILLASFGFWVFVGVYGILTRERREILESGQPKFLQLAYTNGVIARIILPTDSRGQICGRGPAASQPNLFYFDLTQCLSPTTLVTGCLTTAVCVYACPNTTFSYQDLSAVQGPLPDTSQLICVTNTDLSSVTYSDLVGLVASQQCASYYFPSGAINGRCFPGIEQDASGTIQILFSSTAEANTIVTTADNRTITGLDVLNGTSWMQTFIRLEMVLHNVFQDYRACWWMILIGLGVAMILALVWIIVMRWIAGLLVWLAIAAVLGVLSYGTYYTFNMYMELRQINGTDSGFTFTLDLSSYLTRQETWLVFGIIVATVLGIFLLIIVALRNRICIAIALLEEGSRAVGAMMLSLIFPLFPFLLEMLIMACGIAVGMFLHSTGASTGLVVSSTDLTMVGLRNNDSCDPTSFSTTYPGTSASCQFVAYVQAPQVLWYEIFNLFSTIWGVFFVIAMGQMTLAGAFASYYWTWDKTTDLSRLPVLSSLKRACRYHLGTIAFGSLLVAIVRMIRYALRVVNNKLNRCPGSACARFALKCCMCCFWCLEKFLKFVNRNAYIVTAIYGLNFCAAAKEAFSLIMRNILRVFAVNGVTLFLLFTGKLVIVAALGVAAFFFFANDIPKVPPPTLHYIYVPVVTVIIGSYIVASTFFEVYEMAIDTIFICFLEDIERNDGSTAKPYFMPRRLMLILGKHRTIPSADSKPTAASPMLI